MRGLFKYCCLFAFVLGCQGTNAVRQRQTNTGKNKAFINDCAKVEFSISKCLERTKVGEVIVARFVEKNANMLSCVYKNESKFIKSCRKRDYEAAVFGIIDGLFVRECSKIFSNEEISSFYGLCISDEYEDIADMCTIVFVCQEIGFQGEH